MLLCWYTDVCDVLYAVQAIARAGYGHKIIFLGYALLLAVNMSLGILFLPSKSATSQTTRSTVLVCSLMDDSCCFTGVPWTKSLWATQSCLCCGRPEQAEGTHVITVPIPQKNLLSKVSTA